MKIAGVAGQRLHQRSHYGNRVGDDVELSDVEAAYLIATGRIEGDLLDVLSRCEVPYLAYRDIRERGLVLRPEEGDFLVWERGQGPPAKPWFRLRVHHEREPVAGAELVRFTGILGVVDDDGSVTYYESAPAQPVGSTQPTQLPHASGTRIADRVYVEDPAAREWLGEGIGMEHGDMTVISLLEAGHLIGRGVLDAEVAVDPVLQGTYDDLRSRGVLARSGFRFGTHLRGYSGTMEGHAEWLIDARGPDERIGWSTLARGVRLAHGVRKSYLIGVDGAYTALSWFRP